MRLKAARAEHRFGTTASERLEQCRQVGRRILEVCVQHGRESATRLGESGPKSRTFAPVALMRKEAHLLWPLATLKDAGSAVVRPVVDDDDLP